MSVDYIELKDAYIGESNIKKIIVGVGNGVGKQVRPPATVIYDDFQGNTLDTSKWTDMSTGSAYVQVNNGLILSNNNNGGTVYLKSNKTIEGTEKKITMEMTVTEQQGISEIIYGFYDQPNGGYTLSGVSYSLYYPNNPRLFSYINGNLIQTSVTLSLPIKYKIEVDFVNNTTSIWANDTLYTNNVSIPAISNYIGKPVWIGAIAGISNRWNKIGYIRITIE